MKHELHKVKTTELQMLSWQILGEVKKNEININ